MRRRRAKPRKKSEPISIADLLDGSYPGRDDDRPLVQTFAWWDRTVPPRIAAQARPVDLRRGTLFVHVRTAAWAQELSFHERDLLARIRARVPAIQRVRIRVGPMPAPPRAPDPEPPKVVPLPVAALPNEVARALAGISDDRLRDVVTRAACTSLGRVQTAPNDTPRRPPQPPRA